VIEDVGVEDLQAETVRVVESFPDPDQRFAVLLLHLGREGGHVGEREQAVDARILRHAEVRPGSLERLVGFLIQLAGTLILYRRLQLDSVGPMTFSDHISTKRAAYALSRTSDRPRSRRRRKSPRIDRSAERVDVIQSLVSREIWAPAYTLRVALGRARVRPTSQGPDRTGKAYELARLNVVRWDGPSLLPLRWRQTSLR
jgi:hypothetical protein